MSNWSTKCKTRCCLFMLDVYLYTVHLFEHHLKHHLDTIFTNYKMVSCVYFNVIYSVLKSVFVCLIWVFVCWVCLSERNGKISNLYLVANIRLCLFKIWPRWSFTIIRPPFLYVICRLLLSNVDCFITKMESECAYVSINVLKFEFWANIFMS